jgi:hypothetical protein
MKKGFLKDTGWEMGSMTTFKSRNSGDTDAAKRQCTLLSEIHDELSHDLVALPWTKLSCRCGNALVPKPLDAFTSWIKRPLTQPDELKKQTLELFEMKLANSFTAGRSNKRKASLMISDT